MGLPRFSFLLGLLLASAGSPARTLYVSTSDLTVRGTSWEEPVNLRTALFRATDGDEIWVKAGFYDEPIVLRPGVSIYGGFVGNETSIDQRIPFANDTIVGATTHQPYFPGPIITAATGTTIDGLWIGYGDAGEERGGGIRCHGVSDVRVANCFFRSNRTDLSGGGISIRDSFEIVVDRSIFVANRAGSGGQASAVNSSKVVIANSLFVAGRAEVRLGGGSAADIGSGGSSIEIENCTLGIGALSDDGTVVSLFGGKRILKNCFVAANGIDGRPLVTHCNLYEMSGSDYLDGGGNIFADPLFRGSLPGHETEFDPMSYSLIPSSPCIDAGTVTGFTEDLFGNPRSVDLCGKGFEGETAVDIGAIEFQLSPADLDGNGSVNGEDLILFQEQWQESE